MLDVLEKQNMHLTAAVVSNDIQFVNHILANTVNGTTYAGIGARTTGMLLAAGSFVCFQHFACFSPL